MIIRPAGDWAVGALHGRLDQDREDGLCGPPVLIGCHPPVPLPEPCADTPVNLRLDPMRPPIADRMPPLEDDVGAVPPGPARVPAAGRPRRPLRGTRPRLRVGPTGRLVPARPVRAAGAASRRWWPPPLAVTSGA